WHKWAGVTILVLSALRLAWRLTHRPPAAAPMPAWQLRASRAAHTALYVLFFAVPLAGWAYSSAAGFPVVWFGVLPLPDFVGPDRALSETLKPVHQWLAYALAATVALHVTAALKHHFLDRDGLLLRMMPPRRRGGAPFQPTRS
ncbi:MAG TPA: cytochrome b, partial [Rubrivivax sp.]|nr:cytochrome b [Rubrivivax sp.]